MLQRIHKRLGTAGFIISIIALVVALTGGAYAASGGLNGKQKKEVEKIAKKYAGKPGPAGAAGAAGPAGPKGDSGAKGDLGAPGINGTAGANGKSVVVGNATNCADGGKTIEVEGSGAKSSICNGLTGFTDTLPGEKTETGVWTVGVTAEFDNLPKRVGISFAIPLAAPLAEGKVHFVASGQAAPAGCTGGTAAEPTADPGNLCVYAASPSSLTFQSLINAGTESPGAGTTGAVLQLNGGEEATALGTWAVTAEVE
jgi:hypothetical protein